MTEPCAICDSEQVTEKLQELGTKVSNQGQEIIGYKRTIERQNNLIGKISSENIDLRLELESSLKTIKAFEEILKASK